MGIPKYFKHITGKYPNVIISTDDKSVNIDNLYFDMNCLIHPCVRNVTKNNTDLVNQHNTICKSNKYKSDENFYTDFEKKIYKEINLYLDKLINIVNPNKLIYLAIDGVAPRAKMEQQRVRRYRSIKIAKMENEIYNKHNVSKILFDTNCITPGTIFMYKLSKNLQKYCFKNHNKSDIKMILDDTQNKGEGEHKILQYLKSNTKDEVNCIYGLDADLIMLSLCSGSKVYLLREDVYFGKVDTDQFLYLNTFLLGDLLYKEISDRILNIIKNNIADDDDNEIIELERQFIINDYICLCFLIGNDFLPHINGIDILNNSINDLLRIYIDIFAIRNKYLVIDNEINFIFMRQIITYLYSNEHEYLPKYKKKIDRFKPYFKSSTELEREIERLHFYPIFNKNRYLQIGYDDWIDKYYKYYFNINNIISRKKNIQEICDNYIEGLQWNIKYYLDECPSYSWFYKYRAAPCLRELSRYLISRVYPAKFDNDINFSPLEQLAIVLPIQSSDLWAEEFRKTTESDLILTGYYPLDFKLDTLNNHFLYQCDPILMEIDHNYIKQIFKSIQLTSFEQIRNIPTGLYKYGFDCEENISVQIDNVL